MALRQRLRQLLRRIMIRALTSLIPASGIQFLDLDFDVNALPRLSRPFWDERPMHLRDAAGDQQVLLRVLEQTEAGSLDMVFCYDRPKSKRLGAMPLYGEDLVIVGPPDLLGPEQGAVVFSDLPNFPLIMSGTQRGARAFVM